MRPWLSARRIQLFGRLPWRAIADSGVLVVSGGVFQASNFLVTVFVARTLGRAELGRYAVANAIGSVVVSGLGGGLPILVIRETAIHGLSAAFLRRAVRTELWITGAGTVVAGLVGSVVIGGRHGLVLGLLAGGAYIMLSQVALLAAVHSGLQRYRRAAAGRIACAGAIVLFTAAALVCDLGVPGALAALAVAGAFSAAWLLWTARREFSSSEGPDSTRLFSRSMPLIGMGLVYGGYQRVDVLIVLALTSASTAGVYASSYRMLSPFNLAAAGFGTVFLARLSALGRPDSSWHDVRRRGSQLFAKTILPLVVLAFLAMPALVRAFYGPAFAEATGPARVLLLSLIPYAFYIPNAHAVNAAGRERHLLAVLVAGLGMEVALMIALSPTFGAAGAAWAWVLTECWVFAGVSWIVRYRMPVQARTTG